MAHGHCHPVEAFSKDILPIGANGEKTVEVTCAGYTGILQLRRFRCPGLHEECIEFNGKMMTPKAFCKETGRGRQKDWKGSIKINNMFIRQLMASGYLDFYDHDNSCVGKCANRNHIPRTASEAPEESESVSSQAVEASQPSEFRSNQNPFWPFHPPSRPAPSYSSSMSPPRKQVLYYLPGRNTVPRPEGNALWCKRLVFPPQPEDSYDYSPLPRELKEFPWPKERKSFDPNSDLPSSPVSPTPPTQYFDSSMLPPKFYSPPEAVGGNLYAGPSVVSVPDQQNYKFYPHKCHVPAGHFLQYQDRHRFYEPLTPPPSVEPLPTTSSSSYELTSL